MTSRWDHPEFKRGFTGTVHLNHDESAFFLSEDPGYTNHGVRWLQRTLNALGYPAGNEDGMFGRMTALALRKYALAHKLAPLYVEPTTTVKKRISISNSLSEFLQAQRLPPMAKMNGLQGFGAIVNPDPDVKTGTAGVIFHKVTWLQTALCRLGKSLGSSGIDGKLGSKTITAFQEVAAGKGFPNNISAAPASVGAGYVAITPQASVWLQANVYPAIDDRCQPKAAHATPGGGTPAPTPADPLVPPPAAGTSTSSNFPAWGYWAIALGGAGLVLGGVWYFWLRKRGRR